MDSYLLGVMSVTGGEGSPVAMETDLDATETSAMETSVSAADSNDRNVCFVLFRKFIKEVRIFQFIGRKLMFCPCKMLVSMRQYKDDLLASCLHLLLSLPKEMVELELEGLVPALQVC